METVSKGKSGLSVSLVQMEEILDIKFGNQAHSIEF